MTDTATASVLMTDIRRLTDTESDANISDAYLLTLVDRSYNKLYRKIATRYAGFFDMEYTSINLVVGTRTYALPSDFMHLRGVDIVIGNDRVSLKRIAFGERNIQSNDPRVIPLRLERMRSNYGYLTQKDNLRIEPLPSSTEQLILTYVPRPTRISNSSTTFDVIGGFDDFIIYDAAIQVLAKQERDPMVYGQLRADALAMVIETCSPRETGDAIQVRDEYFYNGDIRW
jgi:hypothetical protein